MTKRKVADDRTGFSLIEVVVATGIFAVSIVAVVGLMGPLAKRGSEVVDSEIAVRLAGSIQVELDRVAVEEGFEGAVALVRDNGPITLFADPTGARVAIATTADSSLVSASPPGIANRDRYFRIVLVEQTLGAGPPPATGEMGAFPMRADVEWPYWIPVGPATADATEPSADPHREVPVSERNSTSYFFSIRRR